MTDTIDLLAKAMCEAFNEGVHEAGYIWDWPGTPGGWTRDRWRRAAKAAMDLMRKRVEGE